MSEFSLVFVAGMHRSGTSATVRLLNLIGASLGDESRLMEAQPDNPLGFWEARDFSQLNDRLLLALGGSWKRPPALWRDWADAPAMEPWRAEAAELVAQLVADGAGVHAVKDPRFCLTLPLWLRVTPEARVLIPFRDPLAVAQSLQRRNGMPIADGVDLWLTYIQTLFAQLPSDAAQPVLVDYEDLLADPYAASCQLAEDLGLPQPSQAQLTDAAESVAPSLNHAEPDSMSLPETWETVNAVYQRLKQRDLPALRPPSPRKWTATGNRRSKKPDSGPEFVLHIGANLAATSMLGPTLAGNRSRMLSANVLYPECLGEQAHWRLHALAMDPERAQTLARRLPEMFSADRSAWSDQVRAELVLEANARRADRVVLSDHTLHTVLRNDQEVKRLRDFIDSVGSVFRVVIYLQRQDRAMISRWLGAVERGQAGSDPFASHVMDEYRYEETLELWARGFGDDAIVLRTVEDVEAMGRDVVEDFVMAARLPLAPSVLERPPLAQPLSPRALRALWEFDRAARRTGSTSLSSATRRMVTRIAAETFSGAGTSPFGDRARDVVSHFRPENARIAQRWLGRDKLFDEGLNDYQQPGVEGIEDQVDGYLLAAGIARQLSPQTSADSSAHE